MKLKTVLAFCLLSILLLSAVAIKPSVSTAQVQPEVLENVTINLSNSDSSSNVLAARFLNMLNHNLVYGEDFCSVEKIVNLSVIANLAHADENREFVKSDIVYSYVYDMYGIEIVDTVPNPDLPEKAGHLYIVPQGISVYKHTNAQFSLNEDGSYTVTTLVSVENHDGESETFKASTLFVKNPASAFGFNIVSSDFIVDSISI
ncbi:MAG: hypothetical protein E7565_08385 [Ruminococcaceae bacterium]|nr:hypothetical protein [Oscillospiraceae bacterium]